MNHFAYYESYNKKWANLAHFHTFHVPPNVHIWISSEETLELKASQPRSWVLQRSFIQQSFHIQKTFLRSSLLFSTYLLYAEDIFIGLQLHPKGPPQMRDLPQVYNRSKTFHSSSMQRSFPQTFDTQKTYIGFLYRPSLNGKHSIHNRSSGLEYIF